MNHEILLFLNSLLLGILLTVIYDGLQVLRRLFPHGYLLIAAEDVLFWVGSGIYVFCRIYQENDGIVRFYVFAAILLGSAVWKSTAENIFITISLKILEIPVKFLGFLSKRLLFLERRCRILLYKIRRKIWKNAKGRKPSGERIRKHEEGKRSKKKSKEQE